MANSWSPLLLLAILTVFLLFVRPSRPDPDIICSTANPNSCYPKIFKATHEFQAIQAGQAIPGGLHVRMNLETGVKEAKIYNPKEDEQQSETHAIAFEAPQSGDQHKQLILGPTTDDEEEEEEVEQAAHNADPSPPSPSSQTPPPYSNTGRITPPKDGGLSSSLFADTAASINTILSSPSSPSNPSDTLTSLLTDLEDFAHDLYFGLEIASNPSLSAALFALITSSSGPFSSNTNARALAATTLGSALRNNPSALDVFIQAHPGAIDALLLALQSSELDVAVKTKMVYLMSSLMAGPKQQMMFRVFGGHKDLLKVFDAPGANSGDGKDGLRDRIARLVGDWPDEESGVWCEALEEGAEKFGEEETAAGSIWEALGSLREAGHCV